MDELINIAIDGPAGCGKSTVAKELSKRLNIIYLDTGAMYRGVAYYAMKNKIKLDGSDKDFLNMLENMTMEIKYIDGSPNIYINGENVSPFIRSKEVSLGSSAVAKIPQVRTKMVELQKLLAKSHSVVMDGRDIGTKVLPFSKHKFFLTASVEERAKRRYLEVKETGVTQKEIMEDIIKRDENDSTRAISPLVKAEDAMEIDTSNMTVFEVVELIMKQVSRHVL